MAVGDEDWQVFGVRFQALSLHVWMTLVRLREHGADGADVAQALFEKFWDDLPRRMTQEEGLSYLEMRKWVPVCEKLFLGMGTSFDAALAADQGRDAKMRAAIARNMPLTRGDPARVQRVLQYIDAELERLDKLDKDSMWNGAFW